MRRVLLGLLLGALLFAGAVGAKVVTVTNPMTSELDAAGHAILNGGVIYGTEFQATSGSGVGVGNGHVVFNDGASHLPTIFAGTGDPTVCGDPCNYDAGSLYLRHLPDGTAQAWLKTGPLASDWHPLALVP